jgi:hypothetical protein
MPDILPKKQLPFKQIECFSRELTFRKRIYFTKTGRLLELFTIFATRLSSKPSFYDSEESRGCK